MVLGRWRPSWCYLRYVRPVVVRRHIARVIIGCLILLIAERDGVLDVVVFIHRITARATMVIGCPPGGFLIHFLWEFPVEGFCIFLHRVSGGGRCTREVKGRHFAGG
jgi:hypothetical protein